jgi:thiol-disulfide isomerase/thioredoxin
MKKTLFLFLTLVLLGAGGALFVFFSSAMPPAAPQSMPPAEPGETLALPDVCLDQIQEEACLNPSALRGKIVLFNFWATWCPPCLTEFPFLLETVEQAGGKVALLALSQDQDEAKILQFRQRFLSKYKTTLQGPSVYWSIDPHQELSSQVFGVYKVPETFVLNVEGRIVRKIVGPVDQANPPLYDTLVSLDPSLAAVLSKPEPPRPNGRP